METIGLIAAMALESRALLRQVMDWQPMAIGGLRGHRFDLQGKPCLLVTSGMGVRRAAQAARDLVERHSPGMLISFGIAGAVEADLEIGDVVLPEAVCRLEGRAMSALSPLASWPDIARQAAAESLAYSGKHLYHGTAITTGGSQVAAGQLAGVTHPILEMETAGIAGVAVERRIPLLALRAISDGPCAPIPFDLGEMMDEDANLRLGHLLREMVRHPRLILQSMQMRWNSNRAAECAVIALLAALSQPGF